MPGIQPITRQAPTQQPTDLAAHPRANATTANPATVESNPHDLARVLTQPRPRGPISNGGNVPTSRGSARGRKSGSKPGDAEDQEPLVVQSTDPHRVQVVSNWWGQIFSNLHDAASHVQDMARRFGDMGMKMIDAIMNMRL